MCKNIPAKGIDLMKMSISNNIAFLTLTDHKPPYINGGYEVYFKSTFYHQCCQVYNGVLVLRSNSTKCTVSVLHG